MKALRRFIAVARKELLTISRFRFSLLTQFFISPTVSVLTAGLLYNGFFRRNSETTLGEINAANYKAFLLVGLLTHTCIGLSYYGLATKIVKERFSRTLALLWVAPGNRLAALAGLAGPEALRCVVLAVIGFGVVSLVFQVSTVSLIANLACLTLVFSMGLALGFIRGALTVAFEGSSDLIDQFYFVFVFTSCLYIPAALLPSFLRPLCEANPLYHANMIMKGILDGKPIGSHLGPFTAGLAAVAALTTLVWTKAKGRIMEGTPT